MPNTIFGVLACVIEHVQEPSGIMFLKPAMVTWVNSTTNTCITAARPGHDDVCA